MFGSEGHTLMLGLDSAGKTTCINKLNSGVKTEVVDDPDGLNSMRVRTLFFKKRLKVLDLRGQV